MNHVKRNTDTWNISGTVSVPNIERLEIDKKNLSNGNVTLYLFIYLFIYFISMFEKNLAEVAASTSGLTFILELTCRLRTAWTAHLFWKRRISVVAMAVFDTFSIDCCRPWDSWGTRFLQFLVENQEETMGTLRFCRKMSRKQSNTCFLVCCRQSFKQLQWNQSQNYDPNPEAWWTTVQHHSRYDPGGSC